MKHGFIKVAAVSPQLKVADVPFNTSKILEKIDEAAKEKAKIVVFPELCITGYTCGDLFLQRTLIKAAKEAFDALGLKKLPTIKALSAEYDQLITDKKKLYAEYRKVHEEMTEMLTVRANMEQMLKQDEAIRQEEKNRANVR